MTDNAHYGFNVEEAAKKALRKNGFSVSVEKLKCGASKLAGEDKNTYYVIITPTEYEKLLLCSFGSKTNEECAASYDARWNSFHEILKEWSNK